MIEFRRLRQSLQEFNFSAVFRELGWANPPRVVAPEFQVDGARFRLTPIAEQGGLVAFEVSNMTDGSIPTRATQLALHRQLAKVFAEHFLVFVNRARNVSLWLWVGKREGKARPIDVRFDRIQSGELLLQKLSGLFFDYDDLDEEGKASIGQVLDRLNANFYAEKVTKRFYEDFRKYKDKFITFIQGIETLDNRQWYASVILNRLMFIYFLQQKRFLSGDTEYLQTKFEHCEDEGLNYYRDFLCPLFFKGFALRPADRDAATNKLLGTVPYLNGGLFLEHPHLEADGKLDRIRIDNGAFKRLLAFFDEYTWHLDERPMKNDREINPDVLGYIFEKYVNQKQMGAYYTKEDITEYISKSTIIPFILDAVAKKCPAAFTGDGYVWKLLQLDPDRYIYDAVKKGVELPLPPEIAEGLDTAKPNLIERRKCWNKPAPPEYALPTEIWREVVARRQRYAETRAKLAGGEVKDINSLVTLNLNLVQFMVDVIHDCSDPELLTAIYYTMAGRVPDPEKQSNQEIQPGMSILDPTCGSGAFLFAALNILEPLYEACLSKMREMIESQKEEGRSKKCSHFQRILDEVDDPRHPNQRYFILKSIVINNLFGVDLMEEAVEICKLRLFLKLAAQVDADPSKDNLGIEPLPDIDFNIRAGNTLVGYATRAEVEKSAESDLLRKKAVPGILEDADITDRAFKRFRQLQTLPGTSAREMAEAKRELQRRLVALEVQLNRFLAEDYQMGLSRKPEAFGAWLKSHQPFHWFIEFYGILSGGGFDVIIGNPPWKEYSAVKKDYTVRQYAVERSGNLYALCSERSLQLLGPSGYFSFIVQLPLVSSSRMVTLRDHLVRHCGFLSVVPCDDRPGKLFDGLEHCRASVFLGRKRSQKNGTDFSITRYNRWASEIRDALFANLQFTRVSEQNLFQGQFPKIACATQLSVFKKLFGAENRAIGLLLATYQTRSFIFYQEATQYWVKATVGLPYYAKNGRVGAPAHGRYLYCPNEQTAHVICSVLNSSLFYSYFIAYGDCFHLSDTLATSFPLARSVPEDEGLGKLSEKLLKDLERHAVRKTIETKDGDEISYAEFNVSESKPILDEIDRRLARHYGLTDEETDFILNYDIKFRLGAESDQEDE